MPKKVSPKQKFARSLTTGLGDLPLASDAMEQITDFIGQRMAEVFYIRDEVGSLGKQFTLRLLALRDLTALVVTLNTQKYAYHFAASLLRTIFAKGKTPQDREAIARGLMLALEKIVADDSFSPLQKEMCDHLTTLYSSPYGGKNQERAAVREETKRHREAMSTILASSLVH